MAGIQNFPVSERGFSDFMTMKMIGVTQTFPFPGKLTTPTRRALTVPSSAVLETGERALVFMDMGGGQLMPMDVVTGRTAGDYTEVLSGLEPGQRVVTSAQYLPDSESNLAEVMKSMIGQMNTSYMNGM